MLQLNLRSYFKMHLDAQRIKIHDLSMTSKILPDSDLTCVSHWRVKVAIEMLP